MKKNTTPCPLCNSTNTIYRLKAKYFSILSCMNCTNALTLPPPNKINYESLDFHRLEISAHDTSPKSFEKLPRQWRNAIRQQLAFIKKHISANAKVLEIGCGEGIFLNELKKSGYETCGIEPSKEASVRAENLGLDIIQGYFPNEKLKNKKFDLIIMSQVLEHIENPLVVLKNVKNVLSTNGKILLVQTNYRGLMPRMLKEKWYPWVPEQHFWHFTPNGILHLANKIGFKKVACEYSSLVHYHENYSLKNIIWFFVVQFINLFPNRMKDQFHIMLSAS